MKSKLFFLSLIFCSISVLAQKISTTRIGDLKLGMNFSEVEEIVNHEIELRFDEENHENHNMAIVNYNGNQIKIKFNESVESAANSRYSAYTIYQLTTTDKSFKTLSGLGVGSSLEQLLNAYKKYEICIYKDWHDNAGKNDRLFTLTDNDAGTTIMFYLKNNIVSKIQIYFSEEYCC